MRHVKKFIQINESSKVTPHSGIKVWFEQINNNDEYLQYFKENGIM